MQKKLKLFDLTAALAGASVVTGDGRRVTELYCFSCNEEYPVHAVIQDTIEKFTRRGRYFSYRDDSVQDLFMAPVMVQCWVNVYRKPEGYPWIGQNYKTEEEALEGKSENAGEYISTIMLWEREE